MSKIVSLSIKNFRGIREFKADFPSDFVCLIGRGDSGKSTILEALSMILSGNWNLSFFDNDFYNCDTSNPIIIEATLIDIPQDLLTESKFGLYLKGYDPVNKTIHDDLEQVKDPALTIQLLIDKELEPKWSVVTNREVGSTSINASDRGKFNTFLVSDYVDRHFSWGKGNPLYSLLKQELQLKDDEEDVLLTILRDAKLKIDGSPFAKFDAVVNKVKVSAAGFGIDISKTKTTIDFKDFVLKDGKMSLHDEVIPFRLKGKGSKRLISMTIQALIAGNGGIVLIDEIEQGLEPDRVQHLINVLLKNNKGQVFIGTHSRDVLVELNTDNLFLVKKGDKDVIRFDGLFQGLLRKNPEAFFAKKIIVAEGPTEIGICKALNDYRVGNGKPNMSYLGVRAADGTGKEMLNYVNSFGKAKFPVCLFCDSDTDGTISDKDIEDKKTELRNKGIPVFDWEKGDNTEMAIMKQMPFSALKEIFHLACSLMANEAGATVDEVKPRLIQGIKSRFPDMPLDFDSIVDSQELRIAMAKTASNRNWFKRQEKAQELGKIIFKYFDQLKDGSLKKQLSELSDWIDK